MNIVQQQRRQKAQLIDYTEGYSIKFNLQFLQSIWIGYLIYPAEVDTREPKDIVDGRTL